MLTAEWPIAGLIPLGVENVTPRLTKPLALQRQPSTHRSLPQLSAGVFMRWGILGPSAAASHFKPRLTSGTSKGSCQDMSPAFRFTCVHWGCSCCIWLGGLRAQDSLHRSEASRLCLEPWAGSHSRFSFFSGNWLGFCSQKPLFSLAGQKSFPTVPWSNSQAQPRSRNYWGLGRRG